jgi:hypothetical protein
VELLWRHFGWIGALVLVASAWLLVRCIAGVVRTGKEARLLDVPLVARQEVRLGGAGPVVLEMEGPVFTRPFAGLEFELVGPDGVPVPRRSVLFRMSRSGFTRGTLELRSFDVAVPGPHLLRVDGLSGDRPRDAECRLILKRPNRAASVAWVVGIVLSGGLAIASLVLTILRLSGATLE